MMGGTLGSLAGGGAGAVVGGGPEDVPADVAGIGLGAYAGSAMGANALPQLIKSERDRYAQALAKGQVGHPGDFLRIQGQVMKDTAEAATIGILTAGGRRGAGPPPPEMRAGKNTQVTVTGKGADGARTAAA